MAKHKRNYKDTVFRMLFSDQENLLSLYNAVIGKNYKNPEELEIVTLENAIYMGMKNDLAFIIDTNLYLYEHQSTYNPNIPLRDLFYICSEYQKLGDSISAKDNEIRQIDTQIQDCESRSYSASKALRAQENELRDRQAYNLGERVKAQQEYDTAAAELERYKTASGSGAKSQKKAAEDYGKRK